jgi:phosphoribosylaminoimidazolecarboxamide formyltransferase/IMP cyclohydrolase
MIRAARTTATLPSRRSGGLRGVAEVLAEHHGHTTPPSAARWPPRLSPGQRPPRSSPTSSGEGTGFPAWYSAAGRLVQTFATARNPPKAAFYATGETRPGVATSKQLQGRELSYINILDADAAFELVAEFDAAKTHACAIIKHANPCGVALGKTFKEAYLRAVECDPVSRFGGIIALNGVLDGDTAKVIAEIVTDVIIVPKATEEAKAEITRRKNTRLLITGTAGLRARWASPSPAASWCSPA